MTGPAGNDPAQRAGPCRTAPRPRRAVAAFRCAAHALQRLVEQSNAEIDAEVAALDKNRSQRFSCARAFWRGSLHCWCQCDHAIIAGDARR